MKLPTHNHRTPTERVTSYNKKLRVWRAINAEICRPYFNATKGAPLLERQEQLRQELRDEADALWNLGFNVY